MMLIDIECTCRGNEGGKGTSSGKILLSQCFEILQIIFLCKVINVKIIISS